MNKEIKKRIEKLLQTERLHAGFTNPKSEQELIKLNDLLKNTNFDEIRLEESTNDFKQKLRYLKKQLE